MAQRDVNLKIKTDTNEAVRQLRNLERQVNKIGDMADQGQRHQGGFLSKKQVQLYQRIMREIEQTYGNHYSKLQSIEEKHNNASYRQELEKTKKIEAEIRKRQELLRRAEGANKWGEQASPIVQEYHRQKLDEAKSEYKAHTSTAEYKEAAKNSRNVEAEIVKLREVVEQLAHERNRAESHRERLDDLRVMNPNTRQYINSGINLASSGMGTIGLYGYAGYVSKGVDALRQQEGSAQIVAQKMGSYYGYDDQDDMLRTDSKDTGAGSNYSVLDTTNLMQQVIQGGTSGSLENLLQDTEAYQKYSRAFATDPTMMAESGTMLQHMGALDEGQMKHFADLLAGSIKQANMGGREEEMLRATTGLVSQVSSHLATFTEEGLGNILGLQTQLGNAVPQLSGERGAEVLANMDSAIKGGDNAFDIIMGKGINPEFSGAVGVSKLNELKEQGISNPKTLQYMFQGLDRLYGTGDDELTESLKMEAAAEQFGLTRSEYKAMKESGLIDKFKNGETVSAEELRNSGAVSTAEAFEQYQKSSTAEFESVEAQGQNLQGDHAQPYEEVATGARSLWHSLPDWMQHAGLIGGGILGGFGVKALGGAMMRRMSPRAGGGGAGGGGLMSKIPQGLKDFGTGAWNKTKGWGSKALEGGGKLLKAGGKLLPFGIGTAVGTGVNLAQGDSWGESLTKGIGSAIGGTLGFLGGTALGLGTGGLGFLGLGATTVGGSVAGEKIAGGIYDFFSGNGGSKPTAPSVSPEVPNSEVLGVSTAASNYDQAYSSNGVGRKLTEELDKVKSEHVIKITIDGSIAGMDKDNEDQIKDEIKEYFHKLSRSSGFSTMNLSLDQTRIT